MISITKDELLALNPCNPIDRIKLFGRCSSLTVEQALDKGATIRDILWVAVRTGRKDLCIEFALRTAERVQHLDKSGKATACLIAVRNYLSNKTPANLEILRKARSAYYAAYADAAYAYAAYAYAADAAYAYAADAAYYAADAAYAAYYAAAAARNKEIAEQKKILIEVFSGSH